MYHVCMSYDTFVYNNSANTNTLIRSSSKKIVRCAGKRVAKTRPPNWFNVCQQCNFFCLGTKFAVRFDKVSNRWVSF